jgi:hypothetical protein
MRRLKEENPQRQAESTQLCMYVFFVDRAGRGKGIPSKGSPRSKEGVAIPGKNKSFYRAKPEWFYDSLL